MLVDNPAVTHVNARRPPPVVAEITSYLQMLQAWLLFAPDAPLTDAAVAVDAVTTDGRHVDPLNVALSPGQPWLGTRSFGRASAKNALAAAYMLRIPFHPEYFGALTDWILAYPDRTERRRIGSSPSRSPPSSATTRLPAAAATNARATPLQIPAVTVGRRSAVRRP